MNSSLPAPPAENHDIRKAKRGRMTSVPLPVGVTKKRADPASSGGQAAMRVSPLLPATGNGRRMPGLVPSRDSAAKTHAHLLAGHQVSGSRLRPQLHVIAPVRNCGTGGKVRDAVANRNFLAGWA